MKVLAVGVAGNVAGLVVPALVERGVKVRALAQKPEQIASSWLLRYIVRRCVDYNSTVFIHFLFRVIS